MSTEPSVSTFKPAAITPHRSDTDNPTRAAGFAAGWAAGARAAADAAKADRERMAQEHAAREAARDAATARAVAALGEAIEQWHSRAVPVLDDARRSVYAAALDLASAVLQREVEPGAGSARTLLTRALDLPVEASPTVLRLHPQDLLHVNLLIESGQADVPAGLTLVPDSRLEPGDAITEHENGALDARISTALARAREVLLGDSA
ncbi:flagellar assembly protein FliH [Demequina sp. TTPB684]|uniref:FliH/SctL family protein n=1 Tax=unclassified Demequina TaxID=2620311 RepID=UPI001CF2511B|nr:MULTISPECIES: FliH/SctL family protein [unclassified Demequina]MCB2411974.1 flagellar assembly protein FliH [Demequina sp. TTPB684]UPU87894.1 flagellar assembly protein FliH [Demequina sp. TMPB413]